MSSLSSIPLSILMIVFLNFTSGMLFISVLLRFEDVAVYYAFILNKLPHYGIFS